MQIFGGIVGSVISVFVLILIILWIIFPILINLIRIDVKEMRKTLERIGHNHVILAKYVIAKAKAEKLPVEWGKK